MSSISKKSAPRVLVVEGRRELRNALKDSLSSTFVVLAARSAQGALGGIEEYRPRVVLICEKQAGELSGLELAATLRGTESTKDCLLVVYGGGSIDAATARSRYGVDEYIGKEVTLKQLGELLCKHLRVGWTPMAQTGPLEEDTGRWKNPMTEERVMSARIGDEGNPKEKKKKGFFSRLFGA